MEVIMNKMMCGTILVVLLALITWPLSANSETVFTRDAIITGGGIITEGHGKDAPKITFGINLFVEYFVNENGDPIDETGEVSANGQLLFAEEPTGEFYINFHNTSNDDLDKGKFTTTDVSAIRINPASFPDSTGDPNFIFVSMTANGKFNGEYGWSIVVRISDFGSPGNSRANKDNLSDAIRISLIDPDEIRVYDTATLDGDYPRNQGWRTLLDGGNITVYY